MGVRLSDRTGDAGSINNKSIRYYFAKYKGSIVFLVLSIVLGIVIGSITPYLYGVVIDSILLGDLNKIKLLLCVFCGLNIVSLALSSFESAMGTKINLKIGNDIKTHVFGHILTMKTKEQDLYSSGELLNRTEGDADAIVGYYINVLTSIVMIAINLFVSIFFLIKISKVLTVVGVLLLPVNYFINYLFRNKIKLYQMQEKRVGDTFYRFLNSVLNNLKNVKVLMLEKLFINDFSQIKDEQYKAEMKNVYLSIVINFLQQIFNQFFEIIIIFISAILIIKGELSIGMMVSFNSYLEKLFGAISKIISLNLEKQTLEVSKERIGEICDTETEILKTKNTIEIKKIEFMNVHFSYGEKLILKGVTFSIEQNGLYSIVGENGSGKTTILKLIDKLYDISNGTICLDGKNIEQLNTKDVRKNISYMMKENMIISASLKDNIILGCDENWDDSDIIKICERLQLNELIHKIGGINACVNEGSLSSGEKQKIGIARVLINRKKIVLLDEVTSDMDAYVEKQIVDVIKEIAKTSIVINVAHRQELIVASEKIFVLKNGKIVEEGNHEKLVNNKQVYASLFDNN